MAEQKDPVPAGEIELAPSPSGPTPQQLAQDDTGGKKDKAAEFLAKNGLGQRIVITAADSARVLRRIDTVILPLMLVVYFLQGLDKATLAYASVFGLIEDTGLHGDQYGWLGSIVYLAQLVMQPPLAWLLVRLPIGKFTAAMVLSWGISLSCMAASHNFGGLLATRFLLGVFEASVAPSFVAITQMWWRRREQTVRTSYWYAMNGITNMFGSLITYGLGHISSTLHAYQIIFIFFGVITVVFSFVMFYFMPDSPIEAKFLSEEDKIIAVERLRMNQMGLISRKWRNDHLKEALLDPKSWFWFALLFSISIPSGGISTFGPLIIKTFGYDQFQTILFNIPFGFVQLVATVGGAFLAQRIKMKGPVIALLCLPPIAGCVMLIVLPRDAGHRASLLAGYYLISVYPGITPLIYSWSSQNTAGDTKRKSTNAILLVGQSIGNVIGPLLYTQTEAPGYARGLRSNLALYVAIIVLVGLTTLYLRLLNRRHAARRVAMGKSAVIIDTSLDSEKEAAAALEAENKTAGVEDAPTVQTGDRAFEDLTDLENEEFVFVL
ncbi:MFS general substrate transporter [Durotheca rogersii]|uniref:MFS general substrate transporter n=1 Tax=Durotheca rogersii TaxID=419775 RepID=UPI002220C40A|nr:MFS general substrate transporter [Durotheca rogersii]KAI5863808.1 MFS general substrate transporter [Durotheca rogersii]